MRVTFVSFDAYPLLNPEIRSGIGGAEVRAVTFARGLKRIPGIDVDFVIRNQIDLAETADGFPIHAYDKPRLTPLRKFRQSVFKRISNTPSPDPFFYALESDVVCCFGVRNDTASIVRSARESGKKVVLFLTSDRNLADAQRQGRANRGVYGEQGHLCRYALQKADRVVAQTPFQLDALKNHLGVTGQLIRNPIDIKLPTTVFHSAAKPKILWVGRADTYSKRADVCIDLAKQCPGYQFQMVMNNHDSKTFQQISASAPANVEIIEHVPFEEIEQLFEQANLLINTSAAEGFPNSFLQAAKYGKPIVSLEVDSGEMLSKFGCGICAQGNIEHMAEVIESLIANRHFYDQASKRARQYVVDYHEADNRCNELHQLLLQMTDGRKTFAA